MKPDMVSYLNRVKLLGMASGEWYLGLGPGRWTGNMANDQLTLWRLLWPPRVFDDPAA